MLVVNKLVTYHMPVPAFIASVQIIVCICLVLGARQSGWATVEPPTREHVMPYLYYSLLFAGSLFTNIHGIHALAGALQCRDGHRLPRRHARRGGGRRLPLPGARTA